MKPPSLRWSVRDLDDFTAREWHGVLALRAEVFVVEQDCAYLDPDPIDYAARHLVGVSPRDGLLMAYARWYRRPDGPLQLGRVVIAPEARGCGLGQKVVRVALSEIGDTEPVLAHAQSYLERFYERLGFEVEGAEFLEDGIPHLPMCWRPELSGR